MTYTDLLASGVELSSLGLYVLGRRSEYFCTPLGADVLFHAGVDGIHYCTAEGFGELIFCVNPMSTPGNYVHPVARDLDELLRLIVTVRDESALEQAWWMSREQFYRYIADIPVTKKNTAALDSLRALGIMPCGDAYERIRSLQAEFDYRSLKFSDEYFEWAPAEPIAPTPPEWSVHFGGGFYETDGVLCRELSVERSFTWGGELWRVPCVYICGEGIVLDIIHAVEAAKMRAYADKWQLGDEREYTEDESEQMENEYPLSTDFSVRLKADGIPVSGGGHCGTYTAGGENDRLSEWALMHYGCDMSMCYELRRVSMHVPHFDPDRLEELELTLVPSSRYVTVGRFFADAAGVEFEFVHPTSGISHRLTVTGCEPTEHKASVTGLELPPYCVCAEYTVEPPLPRGDILLRDTVVGDAPRRSTGSDGCFEDSAVIGIIGGSDGPTAVIMPAKGGKRTSDGVHCAVSSSTFEVRKGVRWRVCLRTIDREAVSISLLPKK